MAIWIRQAESDEIFLLAQMNARLVEDQGSQNPFTLNELAQRFTQWLQTGEWQVDVILGQQVAVGYAVYQQRGDYYYPDQTVVYVRQFYIEREHRGQGLGRAAFERLRQTRFAQGQAILLDVVATNPSGQAFWTALGFDPYYIAMKYQAD